MSFRPFKVRPAPAKAKGGPFQAILSDAHLTQLGVQNQTTAWILGPRPVQVTLWREVVAKNQQAQTGSGRVILLSDMVRQMAGISLSDEVKVFVDGDDVPDADVVSLAKNLNGGDEQAEFEKYVSDLHEALTSSTLVSPGQKISLEGPEGGEWQVVAVNGRCTGTLHRITDDFDIECASAAERSMMSNFSIPPSVVFGAKSALESIDAKLKLFNVQRHEPWSTINPGVHNFLLTGPSQCGKTLILKTLAKLPWPKVFELNTDEPITKRVLEKTFHQAARIGRALIILDDAQDARDEMSKHLIRLHGRYHTKRDCRILLAMASRSSDDLDSLLLGLVGMEPELRVPLPDLSARATMLTESLKPVPESLIGSQQSRRIFVQDMARRTAAYSGGDLLKLSYFLGEVGRQRNEDCGGVSSDWWHERASSALERVRPTTMRGVSIEVPKTRFSDIAGQDELKALLEREVRSAIASPEAHANWNIKPTKGLLMYGPPGCSKTLMARAVATEFGLNFLLVNAAQLVNSYVGESEKRIRELFRRARDASPCVVFFDEFEALGGDRKDGLKGLNTTQTLLTELDGVESLDSVFVLAATNAPEAMDPALLRYGRLKPFMVGLPDSAARRQLIGLALKGLDPARLGEIDYDTYVVATEGCTGAEVAAFVQAALEQAEQEAAVADGAGGAGGTGDGGGGDAAAAAGGGNSLVKLEQRHFEAAKEGITRTVSEVDLQRFADWGRGRGRAVVR